MGLLNEIKKEAAENNTKIQSGEARRLEQILNSLFYLPKVPDEETKFVKQVMTRGLQTQERKGLHASNMLVGDSDFCLRQQVLSLLYKQDGNKELPVSLLRIFEEGNAIHEKWQRLLIRGGYGKAEHMDKTRWFDDYMLSYTPDIDCLIPDYYEGRMIGEIKSMNTNAFRNSKSHPTAYKQLYWYSYLCIETEKQNKTWNGKDYLKGFVLCDDKNTQEIRVEIYDFSYDKVEKYIDRAGAIMYHYDRLLTDRKMVKRPLAADRPDCKKCENCIVKSACWNTGIGRVRLKQRT